MSTEERAKAATDTAILRKYATGSDLQQIAADLHLTAEAVTEVISAVGFARGRARELVREREAALVRPQARPAAPRQEPTVQPQPDTIEQLLTRAETTGRTNLVRQAGRIRTLVGELRRDLDDAAQVIAAEARVERLKAELAAANDMLRMLSRSGAPASSSTPNPKDVRAWAAGHGVACPTSGRIPKDVLAQYSAVQQ